MLRIFYIDGGMQDGECDEYAYMSQCPDWHYSLYVIAESRSKAKHAFISDSDNIGIMFEWTDPMPIKQIAKGFATAEDAVEWLNRNDSEWVRTRDDFAFRHYIEA